KQKLSSQVSYRPRFHRTKRSGARASRHPPRWRAQSDTSRKRDEGGGLISGSRSTRRFYIQRQVFGGRVTRGTKGQWFAGSEVKATTRWTTRGGCLSQPPFAVFWKRAIRTGPRV